MMIIVTLTYFTGVYVKINGSFYIKESKKVYYCIKFTSKRIEKNSKIYINDRHKGYNLNHVFTGYVLNHLLQNTYECSLNV